ncbi:polar amino acid transport system permease protein [Thermocatellispora tengchongensis]|uniref:Polar amino acid transport system permease protein n=1 Tax=Thermocatellispora tengchongensis TaxID=1073253 RepID=A0A840PCP0_9ACTN|nr:amino acid ABC transporter permease [Thermocatellispora tengchongensis]MBB5135703.1 polar amino acid transport system permease protein [Thermocatellispora tengchongensis]
MAEQISHPPGVTGAPRLTRQDAVPVRHYGRGVLAVLVVAVVALTAYAFAANPKIEWPVVGEYLFHPDIMAGLMRTLLMTALGMIFSVIGAVVVALMRMSPSRIISSTAAAYIFVFRGIPLILLLIFVGNLGLFMERITIGVPFTGLVLYSSPVQEVLTPFAASVIGLSLAGSGYMAEIVRGGLLAIGRGQRDAAKALGLNSLNTTRFIVLPQALRVIVPPMGNELISMLKATAIVSVIGGGDLLTVAQAISGANYRTIEMLLVAAVWYFAVIAVLTAVQYVLERRIAER